MADRIVQIDGRNVAVPADATTDELSEYFKAPPATARGAKGRTWTDVAVDALPMLGGAAGGIVGGLGGTVAGLGVGGVPGAIGGAALGGGAGEAAKQLINNLIRDKPAPVTSMQAAGDIATQAGVQGAAEAAGAVAAPVMRAVGQRMMQSAVKPGLKILTQAVKRGDETPRVVQTLLDEGVNVSPRGVAKLQTLLNATNDEITAAVKGASGDISPLKVASRLTDTAKTFGRQVNPQADLEAISQVGENFLNHPDLATKASPMLSVPEAQAMKVGTYARIGEKYGKAGAASIEAEKALGRGLKEEIAAEVPGVAPLNAREGRLIEAMQTVGRRVALSGNRDPVGFAWVTHNPMTFLAALMDRSPAVKSLIARGLYRSAGTAGHVSPQLIRVAVHALATADDTSTDPGNPR